MLYTLKHLRRLIGTDASALVRPDVPRLVHANAGALIQPDIDALRGADRHDLRRILAGNQIADWPPPPSWTELSQVITS